MTALLVTEPRPVKPGDFSAKTGSAKVYTSPKRSTPECSVSKEGQIEFVKLNRWGPWTIQLAAGLGHALLHYLLKVEGKLEPE
jgi:hypothetical protein